MPLQARQVLAKNRRDAMAIAEKVGRERVRANLREAEFDLVQRLQSISPGSAPFTVAQLQSTLAQVREVLGHLNPGLKKSIVNTGVEAANSAAEGTLEYLQRVDRQFKGVGSQPLALDESAMFDAAKEGAQTSILRRLASSGEGVPGAEEIPYMAKMGILDRYGMNVVGHFEDTLRTGILTRKPWEEVKADLVARSPFLQQAPAFWAERIVRTESMGAYNRAGYESVREANAQLGDMCKILSATFDDRTASDSYAVHGQIRRSEEAFETWYGLMQHPPARPNDREIVVPHRISWPIPAYLVPKPRGEVVKRWQFEKRKGSPPPNPADTTVPRNLFGREPPPKEKDERKIAEPEER